MIVTEREKKKLIQLTVDVQRQIGAIVMDSPHDYYEADIVGHIMTDLGDLISLVNHAEVKTVSIGDIF